MKQYSWRQIRKMRNDSKKLFAAYRTGDEETKRRINFYFRNNKNFNLHKK